MMRRALKIILLVLAVIILVPVVAVGGIFVGLNTASGRAFAVREINHLAGPDVTVTGLAGHFPDDLKLQSVKLSDANGVYATAGDVELRWLPKALWSRTIHVTALTAAEISVIRQPAAAGSQSGGGGLPNFQLDIDHLGIAALDIAPALAGQSTALSVAGNAHLKNLMQGNIDVSATAAKGRGTYEVAALLDPKLINTNVTIVEPPDGIARPFRRPEHSRAPECTPDPARTAR